MKRTAGFLTTALLIALAALVGSAGADHNAVERITLGPNGGNAPINAELRRLSADGTRAFFTTTEPLTNDDTDLSVDIYERSGGTTTLISDRIQPGNDAANDVTIRQVSPDGNHVLFVTNEQILDEDDDGSTDLYHRSGGTTTLVSDTPTDEESPVGFSDMSDDAQRIFFQTQEQIADSDDDAADDIYERSSGATTVISDKDNDGSDPNEDADLFEVSADGTRVLFETDESLDVNDQDSRRDGYERAGATLRVVTDGKEIGADPAIDVFLAGVSTDGLRILFSTTEPITNSDGDTNDQDIFEFVNGVKNLVSRGNGPDPDTFGGMNLDSFSDDGTRVFFHTSEQLTSEDGDNALDSYERFGGTTTLLTDRVKAGPDANELASVAGNSADGTRVFFQTNEQITDGDDDTAQDIYERSGGTTTLVSDRVQPGADADAVAFVTRVSRDGTRVFFNTTEPLTEGDGDGSQDNYERFAGTTTLLSDRVQPGADAEIDAFGGRTSDDGRLAYFSTTEQITADDTDIAADAYLARIVPPGGGGGGGTGDPPGPLPGACANEQRGSAGADTLTGTAAGDRLLGLGGNDTATGLPGEDCLVGGAGNDTGRGDAGDDRLQGGGGRDRLNGGAGGDVLLGGSKNDRLTGAGGGDALRGGGGNDRLNGGRGRNSYSGGGGNDRVSAVNRRRERVDCGKGRRDSARVDANDRVRRCERVRRVGRRR